MLATLATSREKLGQEPRQNLAKSSNSRLTLPVGVVFLDPIFFVCPRWVSPIPLGGVGCAGRWLHPLADESGHKLVKILECASDPLILREILRGSDAHSRIFCAGSSPSHNMKYKVGDIFVPTHVYHMQYECICHI